MIKKEQKSFLKKNNIFEIKTKIINSFFSQSIFSVAVNKKTEFVRQKANTFCVLFKKRY